MAGERTVTGQFRVVDRYGVCMSIVPYPEFGEADAGRQGWDRQQPKQAPHRIQSRTITTTGWEDVPSGGEADAG
jgi:hypothetical protein